MGIGISEDHLEAVIDEIGVAALLDEIAQICRLKAEHLRSNWQDEKSARVWIKDAQAIEKLTPKLQN